jgi:hypothetical protein
MKAQWHHGRLVSLTLQPLAGLLPVCIKTSPRKESYHLLAPLELEALEGSESKRKDRSSRTSAVSKTAERLSRV